ncbi:D-2-hydroxyacid dehydrogenase [Erysipelothrix tonsillarum]|uniref:D-2-hydroxyacid dehydrogenase n=1 Tax=Erysipelothrix tonsillarum TaxID=38402 RepID=UPI00036C313A|nr:D-2-hydroxyacid dehydrogenase [Erysipelothrix tonsillarum]
MYKFIVFNVREEERELTFDWAKRHNVEITIAEGQITMDNIHKVEGFDGLSTSQNTKLEPEMYSILKGYGIKQIAQRSAGFDYYDLELATENDLIVTNVPSYSPESIAEYAVTAALSMIRKFRVIEEKTRQQDFRWQPQIRAGLLKEMTVGIVGTGHIGRKSAALFHAFGANVVAFDVFQNDEAKQYVTYVDSIEELVSMSDVVSLHVPATKDNYHQFDAEMFRKFKSTAYLINAARGSIVDTRALIEALDKGQLAGAALDTYENESLFIPKDFTGQEIDDALFVEVVNHDKILFTPHIAHYTNVSVRNIMEFALTSVLEILETGTSVNRVN